MVQKEARLEVIVGNMFGGKSTELIRRVNRHKITKNYQLFKNIIDTRYRNVASHDGMQLPATYVGSVSELEEKTNPEAEVIGIDEIQFFESSIIDLCRKYVGQGRIVIAAGLLKDFRNQYFTFQDKDKNMSDLLLVADSIDFYTAICIYKSDEGEACAREASRIQRLANDGIASPQGKTVLVGGIKDYAPKCWEHYVPYEDLEHK